MITEGLLVESSPEAGFSAYLAQSGGDSEDALLAAKRSEGADIGD